MAAIEKGMRPVLTSVIVSDRLVKVCPCGRPISDESIGWSQRMMRLQKERGVPRALGQPKQLPSLIECCLDLPARDAEEEQSPQRREEVRRFSQLPAQNVRACVGHLNVGRRPVLGGK